MNSNEQISMEAIKGYLKNASYDKLETKIISQLLNERNELADTLLESCVIPVGSKIVTESGHNILFKDSEEYDAVISIGHNTLLEGELETHYFLDGKYNGVDLPGQDRKFPNKKTPSAPYQAPKGEVGDGEPA